MNGLLIYWNIYGKIDAVEKYYPSGDVTEIYYTYDASGNRISKTVSGSSASNTTYYIRDASGNIMGIYVKDLATTDPAKLSEQPIYGASRLGQYRPTYPNDNGYTLTLGERIYELSN
ncbi:MAG: hypothetical protein JJT94_10270, partial [Bernardetiaceae bacterium]|nr:hypothetical protein [Bernardetiaceae bacterium]